MKAALSVFCLQIVHSSASVTCHILKSLPGTAEVFKQYLNVIIHSHAHLTNRPTIFTLLGNAEDKILEFDTDPDFKELT